MDSDSAKRSESDTAYKKDEEQKKRQRSSLLFVGQNCIHFLATLAILDKDDFEE